MAGFFKEITMIEFLVTIGFGIIVGAFIGWHIPQPAWIKKLQDKTIKEVKRHV
jgi:NhaP-type Na+/H+ or K+/H+ antiporter